VRALCVPTDVASQDEVEDAAARVEAELGEIDVWVNDAMTTVFSPFRDVDPDDFRRAVEVTFLGQVWGTMAALERMRPRDRGAIVNVGSALAFVGIPLQSAYCASKFACRGFSESVRAELLHDRSHVRISMVHLPAVNTPQFVWCKTNTRRRAMPVPPIYQPEVAARAIVDTALDGRRERIVGSWNRLLVYLATRAPSFANHFAAIAAWESQLTPCPAHPDDPVNLRAPVDEHRDFGAHGPFDDRAGGFLDPSYLESLPATARKFVVALGATTAEKTARLRDRAHSA
jgi:NAD(P)-dependent dehydrogenase (short-subunit alcohol dehydrogenase family)